LLKVNQGLVEFEGVRSALRNDVSNRWQQMLSAQREVVLLEKEVNLRERLLQAEREQYRIGRVRLSRVIEREDELTQSRQSLIDSSTRFELARLALDAADGSLLRKHEVRIEVEEVTH
jgi:outer membrane protein TolC